MTEPPPGPPPWIDESVQQRIEWRDGDIVVSVPLKSGTTWMMNIVHQLRAGGDPVFADVYAEVPWLELVPGPGVTADELVASFDTMPPGRRAFKSHSGPPVLPYHAPGTGPDIRYVVVARNPDEAVASFRPFMASHTDEWYELWGMSRADAVRPDFATFFDGVRHSVVPRIFGLVASWWPLRDQPNVLLVHFADLKRDAERWIRTVADFLGVEPTDEQWPNIVEYTSFGWMKAHQDKFELRSVTAVPMLDSGAMIRRGEVGASSDDGITPEMSQAIAAVGRDILPDPSALEWCYRGAQGLHTT